jgi:hypothetical protein
VEEIKYTIFHNYMSLFLICLINLWREIMKCDNCLVEDLSIEIMYKGKSSHKNISVVSEHLKRGILSLK